MRAVWGVVVVGAMGSVGCLGLGIWMLDHGQRPFDGTTFEGYSPDPACAFDEWLERERQHFRDLPVRVTGAGVSVDIAAGRLGIELDVMAMLQLVERQRLCGSWTARIRRALAARSADIDLVWMTRFDRDVARATLMHLQPSIERLPVDAELDLLRRRRVHSASGVRLDVERTLEYIESHRSVALEHVPLAVTEVLPRVRDEDVTDIDIDRILSRFETDFRTRAGTRATNIRVAARALNGQVLAPSGIFSFNAIVGPRIEARGYREAPVIVDDELEPGVGGGVCQVATTLHAAAVLGGLEVLERRSHSRPSGYAPLGLDATVIDGTVDLKLRNPYRVPIGILASFPDRYRLRIELVGLSSPGRIDHSIAIAKRVPYYRRVVTKPELEPGVFARKQKGNWGYTVTSTVTARTVDGSGSRKQYSSRYWPVPEVFWIGPGTELGVLPALPDGATGVQLDGATVMGTIPAAVEQRAAKVESQADPLEQ